jgi:hypothetical protein
VVLRWRSSGRTNPTRKARVNQAHIESQTHGIRTDVHHYRPDAACLSRVIDSALDWPSRANSYSILLDHQLQFDGGRL